MSFATTMRGSLRVTRPPCEAGYMTAPVLSMAAPHNHLDPRGASIHASGNGEHPQRATGGALACMWSIPCLGGAATKAAHARRPSSRRSSGDLALAANDGRSAPSRQPEAVHQPLRNRVRHKHDGMRRESCQRAGVSAEAVGRVRSFYSLLRRETVHNLGEQNGYLTAAASEPALSSVGFSPIELAGPWALRF